MNESIVVLGSAFGDEAKAKIVDVLAKYADIVVRFQGGNNAGHTIIIDGGNYVFHMVPCGVFNPMSGLVIASGCVVNLRALKSEINLLETMGFSVIDRLKIFGTATLIVFTDRLDKAREAYYKKSGNIGTTGRGIGTTYEKRAARDAIRFVDIFYTEKLKIKLGKLASEVNMLLRAYGAEEFSEEDIQREYDELIRMSVYFQNCIVDDDYIYNCLVSGKRILYEGAQGAFLDPLHGTYPYVTSYSTIAGSILTSCAIGINVAPTRIVGVVKAYFTRVGNGPLPTYISDRKLQEKLREIGHEYGASTGRPRDCAWLDLVLLKRSMIMNGTTEIALTCIDTLCKIGKVKICTGYDIDGFSPVLIEALDSVKPIYRKIDLSGCSMNGVSTWDDIPKQIKEYISIIEDVLRIPVTMVSYGPDRDQILMR